MNTIVNAPADVVALVLPSRQRAAERQLAGDQIRLACMVQARRRTRRLSRRRTVGGRRLA